MTLNMSNIKLSTQHLRTFGRTCQDMNHITAKIKKVKMPLPHYIKTLVTLLVSTFRALVYKLLVEFEQQLFKVCRVHPGSLCSKRQSSTAEESLPGGRAREASIEFQGQFFDILKGVQQIHIDCDTG